LLRHGNVASVDEWRAVLESVVNLPWRCKGVVRFYNYRGTVEQWIKEGKNAVKGTKLPYHDFVDNQVRLQLFTLA
jgi:hypothetical protein